MRLNTEFTTRAVKVGHEWSRNADGVLVPPELRFDILEEIEKRIPGFPIVLHGSSSLCASVLKGQRQTCQVHMFPACLFRQHTFRDLQIRLFRIVHVHHVAL